MGRGREGCSSCPPHKDTWRRWLSMGQEEAIATTQPGQHPARGRPASRTLRKGQVFCHQSCYGVLLRRPEPRHGMKCHSSHPTQPVPLCCHGCVPVCLPISTMSSLREGGPPCRVGPSQPITTYNAPGAGQEQRPAAGRAAR